MCRMSGINVLGRPEGWLSGCDFMLLGIEKLKLYFYALAIYLLMATGVVIPTPESGVAGAGLGILHLFLLIFALSCSEISKRSLEAIVVILLFSIIFIMGFVVTEVPDYAFRKFNGGILASCFGIVYVHFLISRFGTLRVLESMLHVALFVLFLTVLYKAWFGFLNREVRFFINGPIVFGWLMGFFAMLSLVYCHESRRKIGFFYCALFVCAVLWVQSKGPLLALGVVFCLYGLSSRKNMIWFLVLSLCVVFSLWFWGGKGFLYRFDGLYRLLMGEASDLIREFHFGSIGLRQEMYSQAFNLFLEHPAFGIGSANWSKFNSFDYYPHSIYLELLCEFGAFGFLMFVLMCVFVWRNLHTGYAKLFFIYFMVCSAFSGDLSYLRLALITSVGFGFIGAKPVEPPQANCEGN